MMQLRHLYIRQFRGVAPNTKLLFKPGMNFLLGQNGAGKTTLLKLIVAIVCGNFRLLYDDKRRYAVDLDWELDCLLPDNTSLRIEIAVFIKPKPPSESSLLTSEPEWTVSGKIKKLLPTLEVEETFEFSYAWNEPPKLSESFGESKPAHDLTRYIYMSNLFQILALELLERESHKGSSSEVRHQVSSLLIDLAHANQYNGRFDEALDVFYGITEGEATPFGPRPAYFQQDNQSLIDPSLPMDIIEKLSASTSEGKLELPWISKILNASKVSSKPKLRHKDSNGSAQYKGFDFYIEWADGSVDIHEELSFGQKRLLAFIWYAKTFEKSPLIADELTNGLHSRQVDSCMEILLNKQSFHALQNPLLLDRITPKEHGFVLCSVDSESQARAWCWRNPTHEENERLQRAWDVGFQQLSEILQDQGLW